MGNYIQSLEDETDLQYVMQNQKKLFAKLKSEVEYFDVANIAIDRATGGKLLSVTLKAGGTKSININSNEYEALSYPLFYQHGEIGWGDFDSKYIAYNKYLASRLLKPELKSYGCNPYTLGPDFLTASHKSDYCEIDNDQFERQINTNRFQLCPRLMQVFAVDMTSRQIDRKLNFVARNQDTLKMKNKLNDFEDDNESEDSDGDGDDEEFNDGSEQKPDQVIFTFFVSWQPKTSQEISLECTIYRHGTRKTNFVHYWNC